MNANDSEQRQLTSLPGAEWHASWSPDGTKIVYTAGDVGFVSSAFYILDLETGESSLLLDDEYNNDAADWSPNGSRIAFISDRDGTMDIYAMNADGSGIEKLIDTGLEDYNPDWSPDGTQIVFFAFDLPSIRQDIYVVNNDGSNPQNLTNTSRVVDESASWSPDGSQILFHTDRDRNFEVYIMNANGSQQTNLTNDRGQDYCPDW
jgi:Tol biopolymer transport system component